MVAKAVDILLRDDFALGDEPGFQIWFVGNGPHIGCCCFKPVFVTNEGLKFIQPSRASFPLQPTIDVQPLQVHSPVQG